MNSPASTYSRSSILILPIVSFLACCITFYAIAGRGDVFDAATSAFRLGGKRAFPFFAIVGLVVGVGDWLWPKRRKAVFIVALVANAFAAALGWILAESVIYF